MQPWTEQLDRMLSPNSCQIFSLPQIATYLERWGEVGMAKALRTHIKTLTAIYDELEPRYLCSKCRHLTPAIELVKENGEAQCLECADKTEALR